MLPAMQSLRPRRACRAARGQLHAPRGQGEHSEPSLHTRSRTRSLLGSGRPRRRPPGQRSRPKKTQRGLCSTRRRSSKLRTDCRRCDRGTRACSRSSRASAMPNGAAASRRELGGTWATRVLARQTAAGCRRIGKTACTARWSGAGSRMSRRAPPERVWDPLGLSPRGKTTECRCHRRQAAPCSTPSGAMPQSPGSQSHGVVLSTPLGQAKARTMRQRSCDCSANGQHPHSHQQNRLLILSRDRLASLPRLLPHPKRNLLPLPVRGHGAACLC